MISTNPVCKNRLDTSILSFGKINSYKQFSSNILNFIENKIPVPKTGTYIAQQYLIQCHVHVICATVHPSFHGFVCFYCLIFHYTVSYLIRDSSDFNPCFYIVTCAHKSQYKSGGQSQRNLGLSVTMQVHVIPEQNYE